MLCAMSYPCSVDDCTNRAFSNGGVCRYCENPNLYLPVINRQPSLAQPPRFKNHSSDVDDDDLSLICGECGARLPRRGDECEECIIFFSGGSMNAQSRVMSDSKELSETPNEVSNTGSPSTSSAIERKLSGRSEAQNQEEEPDEFLFHMWEPRSLEELRGCLMFPKTKENKRMLAGVNVRRLKRYLRKKKRAREEKLQEIEEKRKRSEHPLDEDIFEFRNGFEEEVRNAFFIEMTCLAERIKEAEVERDRIREEIDALRLSSSKQKRNRLAEKRGECKRVNDYWIRMERRMIALKGGIESFNGLLERMRYVKVAMIRLRQEHLYSNPHAITNSEPTERMRQSSYLRALTKRLEHAQDKMRELITQIFNVRPIS